MAEIGEGSWKGGREKKVGVRDFGRHRFLRLGSSTEGDALCLPKAGERELISVTPAVQ